MKRAVASLVWAGTSLVLLVALGAIVGCGVRPIPWPVPVPPCCFHGSEWRHEVRLPVDCPLADRHEFARLTNNCPELHRLETYLVRHLLRMESLPPSQPRSSWRIVRWITNALPTLAGPPESPPVVVPRDADGHPALVENDEDIWRLMHVLTSGSALATAHFPADVADLPDTIRSAETFESADATDCDWPEAQRPVAFLYRGFWWTFWEKRPPAPTLDEGAQGSAPFDTLIVFPDYAGRHTKAR
jgi:hypothetical protein